MASHGELANCAEIAALDTEVPYNLSGDQGVLTEYHIKVRSKSIDPSWSRIPTQLDTPKAPVSEASAPLNLGLIEDEAFKKKWVDNQKSPHTIRAYLRISDELINHLHPKHLKDTDLESLQSFMSLVKTRKTETKRQRLAIVRSLFSFAHKSEYLGSNPSALLPKIGGENRLSERYLSSDEVKDMIRLTQKPRDRAMLKLLYTAGLRASELCGITWERMTPREEGEAQIQVEGKGGKVRNVVIGAGTFQDILALKNQGVLGSDFVFRSQKGRRLSTRRLHEIVDAARLRAAIPKKASAHWLRHAHASHALDRGAPIHLVQATLGHSSVATTSRYLHARPNESSGSYLDI